MVKAAVRAILALGVWLGAIGFAAGAPTASPQPDLWRGARVGDDLATLQRRFPQALAPQHPAMLSGGEIEALHMPLGPLAGTPAEALFFMRDGVLAAVQLRVAALAGRTSRANVAFAHAVAAEITRDDGAGYDCADSRIAGVAQYTCRWEKGEVTVREYYLDVAGVAPVFYVAFRRADDPAFDL